MLRHFPEQYLGIGIRIRAPNVALHIRLKERVIHACDHVVIQIERLCQLLAIVPLPRGVVRHDGLAVSSVYLRIVIHIILGNGRTGGHGGDRGRQWTENASVTSHPTRTRARGGTRHEIIGKSQRKSIRSIVVATAAAAAGATPPLGIGVILPAHIRRYAHGRTLAVSSAYQFQYSRTHIAHGSGDLRRGTRHVGMTGLTRGTTGAGKAEDGTG
mmetsp:Transcript_31294/g.65448  ORF Transcript_31294/g.65448 Transcript_31294/m.65448 type:complete len:214 (-) Transcript_31294:519-1160(-)